jgi:hypothetical protein
MTKIAIDPPPVLNIGIESAERILDAIGAGVVPVNLDRNDFSKAVNSIMGRYADAVVTAERGERREFLRRLKSIRNAAQRLAQCVDDVAWKFMSNTKRLGSLSPYREDVRVTLRRVIEDIDYVLEEPQLPPLRQPPFTCLISDLADLFKQTFGHEPTFHRRAKDRLPESPFVRFAEQLLLECRVKHRGKPYARESIAKALSDARTGRSR